MTRDQLAAAGLALAAVVVAAPGRPARRRLDAIRPAPAPIGAPSIGAPSIGAALLGRRRLAVAGAALAFAAAGLAAGGPVAAVALGAYAGAGVHAAARIALRRDRDERRRRALDAVAWFAADLRAGARPDAVGDPAWAGVPDVARRVAAATGLADRTGAPLADVLDRLDADLRAAERTRLAAHAQAAGARASALILAVLPVVGLGMGYAMGADPLEVLLRTRLGAACALAALGLQLGGLAWSARLVRIEALP